MGAGDFPRIKLRFGVGVVIGAKDGLPAIRPAAIERQRTIHGVGKLQVKCDRQQRGLVRRTLDVDALDLPVGAALGTAVHWSNPDTGCAERRFKGRAETPRIRFVRDCGGSQGTELLFVFRQDGEYAQQRPLAPPEFLFRNLEGLELLKTIREFGPETRGAEEYKGKQQLSLQGPGPWPDRTWHLRIPAPW